MSTSDEQTAEFFKNLKARLAATQVSLSRAMGNVMVLEELLSQLAVNAPTPNEDDTAP